MQRMLLVREPDVDVDLPTIAQNLNRICDGYDFAVYQDGFVIHSAQIEAPESYQTLSLKLRSKAKMYDQACFITTKPYDTNLFYEEFENLIILSVAGWEKLTPLSLNNGIAYFIATFVATDLMPDTRHKRASGCVYDTLWDKRGVDIGMRSAGICSNCSRKLAPLIVSRAEKTQFHDLRRILDDVAGASRWHQDILDFWKPFAQPPGFDVFLCHRSSDKPRVMKLARALRARNINPWLDEEQVRPGAAWQPKLDKAIDKIKCAAVMVGGNGIGPWQSMEISAYLRRFVDRGASVIPVLLEDVIKVPKLPVFIEGMQWVDFRVANPNPMKQLMWGITGRK
jgi:hypothetical protein